MLSDYSDTLDGPTWSEYQRIPHGGTPLADHPPHGPRAGHASNSARRATPARPPARCWKSGSASRGTCMPLPIGVMQTDRLFEVLEAISGRPSPPEHVDERGRLIDAYVDAHKYVFGKRAVVYGEQDLVVAWPRCWPRSASTPVLCALGGSNGQAFASGSESSIRQAARK